MSSNFIKDEEWGNYWEGELNKWIEPIFNHNLYLKKLTIAWSTLRSSDIYPKKKDWWRFDTLYHLYEESNPKPIKQVKFEIKADKFDNTGNICIEKMCNNKPSGTFHTEADYFIYYMPRYSENNLYLFKPEELAKYLSKYDDMLRSIGDGKRSTSYIINKELFDADVRNNKIGKIYTWNTVIPDKFGVEKFSSKIVNDRNVYYGKEIKKDYDDDIYF